MSLSIRIVLRKEKKDASGLCPVAVCVTINRVRTYHNVGVKIPVKVWNESSKRINKGFANYDLLNKKIADKLAEVERLLLQNETDGEITTTKVKALLKKDNPKDFISYAESVLKRMGKTHPSGTIRSFSAKMEIIKAHSPRLTFNDITPQFLTKYYNYLIHDKGQQHNTTIVSFTFIRIIFNHAKDEGITELYPFANWKMPVYKEPVKQYLTLTEVDELEKLLYDDALQDSYKTTLAFFLVECYAGIRHSDWHKFKVEKIVKEELFYLTTTKTKERITIPLENYPRLKNIVAYIKDNNLIYTYTLEHTNRALKTIQGIAGIKKNLTTHVGRHTCATILLEAGMSFESVAAILGISDKMVRTYAKVTGRKVREEFKRINI